MHKDSEKTWLAHLAEDRRYAAMAGLGFSSGLPFLLVYSTQSAWLSEAGVPIETIGLLSELTIAYRFKFVWSPFLDKYDPPLLASFVGRRRGWIIVSQIAVMMALAGVAFGDPAHWIAWTVVFSLVLGFAGATQDVTIDGWRITAAPPGKLSLMTAFSEAGYRVGTLVAGAGTLIVADRYGWRTAYLCMAALLTVGALSAFLAPEPESDRLARRDHPDCVVTIVAPIKELAPARAVGHPRAAADRRLPHARLLVECNVHSAVQEPARFRYGHCDGDKNIRLLDCARRHVSGGIYRAQDRADTESALWHGRRVGFASEPRLARRDRPGRLPALCHCRQY